ncbi:hypothetical protein [Aquimarina sp. MMG016]|uniref:hypothetical protein n=1 Tax=Aquimarina sp. MMG016 TaxID=2822690 RepID=UPI001B3A094A|nr:hypothetical protein [Aquimarina sp. MMG016]MBQ4819484.1 hypothetical protein [Aquimarina sp. MMG016]
MKLLNSLNTNTIFVFIMMCMIPFIQYGQSNRKSLIPDHNRKAAFFLDSTLVQKQTINDIDPESIESLNVVKKEFVIENEVFYGEIYIKSKPQRNYKMLTIKEIKDKYISENTLKKGVLLVNGFPITKNIGEYMIDEDYILDVEVMQSNELLDFEKENGFYIIMITTKTKENLEEKKKVYIR